MDSLIGLQHDQGVSDPDFLYEPAEVHRANLTNRANFGTFSGTRGSFSDIGTARMHHIVVGRFEW